MRGRPKKSSTVDHMTATRLTDEQWNYVRHRASAEDLSIGTVLRKIVEEHRQQDDKIVNEYRQQDDKQSEDSF